MILSSYVWGNEKIIKIICSQKVSSGYCRDKVGHQDVCEDSVYIEKNAVLIMAPHYVYLYNLSQESYIFI